MVQARLANFKTGINPSLKNTFNIEKLSPFQKMQLTYCRIWGSKLGDNYKSGLRTLKQSAKMIKKYQYELIIPSEAMPYVEDITWLERRKRQFRERRSRILMRGVKIANRKSGVVESKLSIFDTKKKI